MHVVLLAFPATNATAFRREQDTHLANATGVWMSAAGQKYLAGCRHLFMLSDRSLITYLQVLF